MALGGTDGVSSDFSHAMSVAHSMVWHLGMGDDGFVGNFDVIPDLKISDTLKEKLNAATQRLLSEALRETESVLKAESLILDRFALELLKRDELDYDEIVEIFQEYGKPPKPIPEPPLEPAGSQPWEKP